MIPPRSILTVPALVFKLPLIVSNPVDVPAAPVPGEMVPLLVRVKLAPPRSMVPEPWMVPATAFVKLWLAVVIVPDAPASMMPALA